MTLERRLRARRPVRDCAALLAALALSSCDDPASERFRPDSPQVAVSADELSARFREDESAADEKYAGDTLLVSGPVMEMDQEEIGHPVIVFGSSELGLLARAELSAASRSKAIGVQDGEQVVVRCTGVTMMAGDPLLLNCDL